MAFLVPYSAFDATLEQLKKEHPKARHFVTAFRYLNNYGQIVEGSSDDGEPKGTSGKPSLTVLTGHNLINISVIIVRYFGGKKLGTGGLVRAYTQAVSDAISRAELSEYIPCVTIEFTCMYSHISRVRYLLKACGVSDAEIIYETVEVRWKISAGTDVLSEFFRRAERMVKPSKS